MWFRPCRKKRKVAATAPAGEAKLVFEGSPKRRRENAAGSKVVAGALSERLREAALRLILESKFMVYYVVPN